MDEEKKNVYKAKGIIVSGDSLDRDLLSEAVANFIRIYTDSGEPEIGFTPESEALTIKQKLLVYLLGRKIAVDAELIDKESMTPSEIEAATHISGGTIRPILSKLLDIRLVQKDKDGGYLIPNYSLKKARDEIKGEDK